jgi:hypothetical protein
MPGMDFAFPDVCLTPTPVGPIPIPYPNINMSVTAVPTQFNTFIMCMPAHNMTTLRTISMGDNAGVNLGVMSGMDMGPGGAMMGSATFFVGGPPATKLTMPTKQNGVSPNAIGMTISPSQIRMLVLS